MGGLRRYALALAVVAGVAAAGCGDDVASADLPSFSDITSATPAIQTAAAAVVRIATATGSGTGSFISSTGLLLTNNHVLGAEVCPLEGCSIELRFMFQRGRPVTHPVPVRATPVAVDIGLDAAILQVSDDSGPLVTESFLEIRGQDASSLLGQHVTVVGHPNGRLKKWSDGIVFDAYGDWFNSTAYALPGNSGSPVLNDEGQLVALVHRASNGLDLITSNGVNAYTVATASAALLAAMNAPLPNAMISTAAPTTADEVVANNAAYQNGGAWMVSVGGSTIDVIDLLGQACDRGLAQTDFASPDELEDALRPCEDGQRWIECRGDATPAAFSTVCPVERDAWAARYRQVNEKWVEMNGNTYLYPVTFGIAALYPSENNGRITAANELRAALTGARQVMDFGIANYLAAFAVDDYDGTRSLDWLRGYAGQPAWTRGAFSIASAFLWWRENGAVSDNEVLAVLDHLAHHPDVDVGTKLYVDMMLYFWGR